MCLGFDRASMEVVSAVVSVAVIMVKFDPLLLRAVEDSEDE